MSTHIEVLQGRRELSHDSSDATIVVTLYGCIFWMQYSQWLLVIEFDKYRRKGCDYTCPIKVYNGITTVAIIQQISRADLYDCKHALPGKKWFFASEQISCSVKSSRLVDFGDGGVII